MATSGRHVERKWGPLVLVATENWPRVVKSSGALYGQPRQCKKRRRCDGHLVDRHMIEVGDSIVWSALPPDDNDIGNIGWWHRAFCIRCAPIEHSTPAEREQ